MKALAWIISIIVCSFANVMIGEAIGLRAGWLVLMLAITGMAKLLCHLFGVDSDKNKTETAPAAPPKPIVRESRPGDWTCPTCNLVHDKDMTNCWKCGMKKKDALAAPAPKPAAPAPAPVASAPVAPAPKPQPAAPKGPIPHYVKPLTQDARDGALVCAYQFIRYDYSFILELGQAMIDRCQQLISAATMEMAGMEERDCTRQLLDADCRMAQCPALRAENGGVSLTMRSGGMTLKVQLYKNTNRIFVSCTTGEPAPAITAWLNEMLHAAIQK